jgi:septal ring-binding cell division protein DamX
MSTTDYATDIGLPELETDPQIEDARRARAEGSKPLKGLYFGFAFVVTAGLALASWYVGIRIVSAEEVPPRSAPAIVAPANVAAPPATPTTQTTDSMAEAHWQTVPAAEFYLQAAGLGPKRDAAFMKLLNARGLSAQAQTRDGGEVRILIGPFATHSELEQAQRKLQGLGVLAIEAER